MRLVLFWFLLLGLVGVQAVADDIRMSAHDFSFSSIDGTPLPLKTFKGRVVLVVNTASFCGFTKQYANLQTVWERYSDKGLVVLGIPSNDFGGQEPGSESEIKEFCQINYGIDFPLAGKVHVKGPEAHPFYVWAASELGLVAKPRWNFHKYLINREGELVDWFSSPTSPLSKSVIGAIEEHLSFDKDGTI